MKTITKMLLLVLSIILLTGFSYVEATTNNLKEAESLKSLGLFMGTEKGFELEKAPTRAESAAMLVRLLGAEKEANENNFNHPFTDVPKWADAYVGYMYENKLTTGVGNGKFGSADIIDGKSYATFALRALDYDDSKGDFAWNDALEFSKTVGLLNEDEVNIVKSKDFKRNELVLISYNSLKTKLKDNTRTLVEELMINSVVRPHLAYSNNLLEDGKYGHVPFVAIETDQGNLMEILYSEIEGFDIEDSYYIDRHNYNKEPLTNENLLKRMFFEEGSKADRREFRATSPERVDPKLIEDEKQSNTYRGSYGSIIFYNDDLYPTHYAEIPKGLKAGTHNLPIIPLDEEMKKILNKESAEIDNIIDKYLEQISIIPEEAVTLEMHKDEDGELQRYAKINRALLPESMKNFKDINIAGTYESDIKASLTNDIVFNWAQYNGLFLLDGNKIIDDRIKIRYYSEYVSLLLFSPEGEAIGYTLLRTY